MIAFLVDTDWMSEFLNGREQAIEVLSPILDHGVAISIITYAELFEGVSDLPGTDPRRGSLDAMAEKFDVIGVDDETARVFGRLRSDLRRRGQRIPDLDCLIAATALRHDLVLVSRDKHFDRVPGLRRHS